MKSEPVPILILFVALLGRSAPLAQTANWTEITQPTSPAFAHHDMTYDSHRQRLIVAGRTSIMQNPFAVYAGAADGSWTQLPAPDPPLPGNHDVELAYDSQRDVVVLYTAATNLVWEFNGTTWNVVTAATAPIQCVDGAQMQYDPVRRKTVLVASAGWPGATVPTETWFWDGTNWTLAAGAGASPIGAAGGGMAFDSARSEMVLLTMNTMQTWTFDGTKWTQRQPATAPSPGVWVFDLAYDPVSQLSVFFGGEATAGELSYPTNTWAWNGTDWTNLAPATVPPPDIDFAFTYFPERGGLVLHGGWGPGAGWGFRTNVWLLTFETTVPSVIRFTDLRLVGADVSLTSTGHVANGTAQVLQATRDLAPNTAWANVRTNPAPAGTNTWIVPREGDRRLFRILESDLGR